MGPDGAFITGSDFLMDGGVTAAYRFATSPWHSRRPIAARFHRPRAATVLITICRPLIDCSWLDSATTAIGPLDTA